MNRKVPSGSGHRQASPKRSGRLTFSTDLDQAIQDRQVVFIGVGTPQSESGAADLRAVWTVVDEIRERATDPKIVVVKSGIGYEVTYGPVAEALIHADCPGAGARNLGHFTFERVPRPIFPLDPELEWQPEV